MVVPVPAKPSEPRYSDQQLAEIEIGSATHEFVAGRLGPPDLRRADDRYWIYKWTVDHGTYYLTQFGLVVGKEPLGADRFLLVLSFDENGTLRSRELAYPVKGSDDDRYCTERGVCVEHMVSVARPESYGGYSMDFSDEFSAVSLTGAARDELPWPTPTASECLVTIWPDAAWTERGGQWVWQRQHERAGLQVGIDDHLGKHFVWLPRQAFATVGVPAGSHRIVVQPQGYVLQDIPVTSSVGSFECGARERIYLSIRASTSGGDRFPIVLERLTEESGQSTIAGMPLVLLPQSSTTTGK
jgi:hypothetical protein